jgi:GNAT superfamily N-acetyltransferase
MTNRFEIQTMIQEQVNFAIELAANEGWNPGLHDASCFYNTDPRGFLIGLLDGRPIGCIGAVSYKATPGGLPFGFIGCYIVIPEYRGLGYGIQLWRQAISKLSNHNIGLDGVVAQQANYQKSGFHYAYRNIRFMSVARPSSSDAAGVVAIQAVPFEDICVYDQKYFPAQRREFLHGWINMPDSKAVAYVEGNKITGYGMIRKCLVGYKIGPLFADRAEIAETLFSSLSSYAEPGSPIYLDVPERNAVAHAFAARRGMTKVFETARMYTGDEPAIAVDGIYGVTTLELG